MYTQVTSVSPAVDDQKESCHEDEQRAWGMVDRQDLVKSSQNYMQCKHSVGFLKSQLRLYKYTALNKNHFKIYKLLFEIFSVLWISSKIFNKNMCIYIEKYLYS